MRVGLKVISPFKQGKADQYKPGEFIPDDHWQGWPAETLKNRLNNKWVSWEPVPEDAADDTQDIDYNDLDKDGLVEYALQRFGMKLDKRVALESMRLQVKSMVEREGILAKRAAGAAGGAKAASTGKVVPAARSGESAAKGGRGTPAQPPVVPVAPVVPPVPPAEELEQPAGGIGDSIDQTANADTNTGTGDNPPAP